MKYRVLLVPVCCWWRRRMICLVQCLWCLIFVYEWVNRIHFMIGSFGETLAHRPIRQHNNISASLHCTIVHALAIGVYCFWSNSFWFKYSLYRLVQWTEKYTLYAVIQLWWHMETCNILYVGMNQREKKLSYQNVNSNGHDRH